MRDILKRLFSGMINSKKQSSSSGRDLSLNSGERQIGKTVAVIRYDHIVRYKYAVEYISKHCHQTKNMFGLDIFSAIGYGTHMLSERLSCSMLGVEGSEETVAFANKHYFNEKTLYVNKTFPFELPRATFDFITCFESLEHVAEDERLLDQLVGSLTLGGLLFISVPNEAINPLAKNPNEFHHKHYYHEEIVAKVVDSCGLDLLNWFGQNMYVFEDGFRKGVLKDAEMVMHEREGGQVNIYLFKKRMPGNDG